MLNGKKQKETEEQASKRQPMDMRFRNKLSKMIYFSFPEKETEEKKEAASQQGDS